LKTSTTSRKNQSAMLKTCQFTTPSTSLVCNVYCERHGVNVHCQRRRVCNVYCERHGRRATRGAFGAIVPREISKFCISIL